MRICSSDLSDFENLPSPTPTEPRSEVTFFSSAASSSSMPAQGVEAASAAYTDVSHPASPIDGGANAPRAVAGKAKASTKSKPTSTPSTKPTPTPPTTTTPPILLTIQDDGKMTRTTVPTDAVDLNALTVVRLRKLCGSEGLPVSGLKSDIIQRLQQHFLMDASHGQVHADEERAGRNGFGAVGAGYATSSRSLPETTSPDLAPTPRAVRSARRNVLDGREPGLKAERRK